MSCVPCADPCSSVSKDDLDSWTNKLKNVLSHPTGIQMFEDYLNLCKLDSAEKLELWKMCHSLLQYMHNKKIDKYVIVSPLTYLIILGRMKIQRIGFYVLVMFCNFSEISKISDDYDAIVEYAYNMEGLKPQHLRKLEEVRGRGPKKILEYVGMLKQTIYDQMKDDYQLFRKKLLKDHKVVKK